MAQVWVLFDGPEFRGVYADPGAAEADAEVLRAEYRADGQDPHHFELRTAPVRTSPRWAPAQPPVTNGSQATVSGLLSLAWDEDLVRIAHEHGRSQVGLIQWMFAPSGYLDGDRPIDHLDDGEMVLDVAHNSFGTS